MKITIIGIGNMGGAIAYGALSRGVIKPENLCCVDLSEQRLKEIKERYPMVRTSSASADALNEADLIIIAVKPWVLPAVIEQIKPHLCFERQMLASIVAGVTISDLKEFLGGAMPLFRVMPNTAIEVGESMTLIASDYAEKDQQARVQELFEGLGAVEMIEERLMAAGTSLASCGIAYAMRYVRAAMEGGVEMGFYPEQSREIVLQTLRGAVALLQHTGMHPEAAIDKVTTPGGITIKGLNELEHAGFTSAIVRSLKASAQ